MEALVEVEDCEEDIEAGNRGLNRINTYYPVTVYIHIHIYIYRLLMYICIHMYIYLHVHI
jgi:hypothetical protein